MSPDHHRHLRVGEEIAHELKRHACRRIEKNPRLEGNVCVSEVRVQAGYEARAGVCQRTDGTIPGSRRTRSRRWSMRRDTIKHELVERLQVAASPGFYISRSIFRRSTWNASSSF